MTTTEAKLRMALADYEFVTQQAARDNAMDGWRSDHDAHRYHISVEVDRLCALLEAEQAAAQDPMRAVIRHAIEELESVDCELGQDRVSEVIETLRSAIGGLRKEVR